MKPVAKGYAITISVIGLVVGVLCTYKYFTTIASSANIGKEIAQFVVLFSLAYLCRCLPIYIREDFAIDMSFISNFAILLCKGPLYAAAITLICSAFVISRSTNPEQKFSHIFNTPIIKTAFNTANFTLSVYLGGIVFVASGGIVGDLSFPGVLLPSLFMIMTIMVVNSLLLILLFRLNQKMSFFRSFFRNLLDFMPSVIAAAPIGYFIATVFLMEHGVYLVILFVFPLLLARFSFSMYIDVKQNYLVMMKTLTNTIEAKDDYTRGHSERVERYSRIIAQELHFNRSRIEELTVAALLHDVGKIGIDENILKKPYKLDAGERQIIQCHPQISINILKDVKLSPVVFDVILHHHERYDGTGYPDGLGGGDLSLDVYILGVADTYDAITSDRPYSVGRSAETAKNIILEERGAQFHPVVVDAFLNAYNKGLLLVPHQALNTSGAILPDSGLEEPAFAGAQENK